MTKRIITLLALLSVIGPAASQCGAATTSLLDTIGASPIPTFQVGSEVIRSIEVGFESHPASGLFTGLRPTFHTAAATPDHNPYLNPAFEFGVCEKGTSGVPIGTRTGVWAAQPFTAKASGYIYGVSLVAQNKHSVGQATELADSARNIHVYLVPGTDPGGARTDLSTVAFGGAGFGTIVNGPATGVPVTVGSHYVLIVGIDDVSTNVEAKLNWGWMGKVSDTAFVGSAQQSFGGTSWNVLPGRAIGVTLTGYATEAQAKSIGDAKKMASGPVQISGVITAKNSVGAVPSTVFYVEDPQRSSGVRVEGTTTWSEGDVVSVVGEVAAEPSGEKKIVLGPPPVKSDTIPTKPIFTPTKGVYSGLTTTGLLIKVGGMVQNRSGATFEINDGYSSALKCVGVTGWSTLPANGTTRVVVGVVSLDASGNPQILIKKSTDIQTPQSN